MFNHFSLKFKMTFLNVVAVLGVGVVIGWLAVSKSMESMENIGITYMESILATKKTQMEQYVQLLETNLTFFSKDEVTQQIADELIKIHHSLNFKDSKDFPIDNAQVKEIYAKYDAHFQNYANAYEYQDVFVLCREHGHVLYTVAKESDLGTNLSTGKLKNTNLAKLWRKVVSSGKTVMVDMMLYAPSKNEPAMFIGMPLLKNREMIGVVAFQISDNRISEIMQERTGLGKTGETYLVGTDKLLRSDSILYSPEYSLRASLSHPKTGSVKTKAVAYALQGQSDSILAMNYNNRLVLSVFDSIDFGGVQWAILAEIHQQELFKYAYTLRNQLLWIGTLIIIGVMLINLWFLKILFVSPLQRFQKGLLSFFAYLNREKNTPQRIDIHNQDELGQMSRLVNNNIENIQKGIVQDNKFIENVADIVSKIQVGELQDRVTATAHNPVLNELKNLLNEVLEAMAGVLAEVGNTLDKLANGQLEARIIYHYEGEYAHLQSSCNGIAEQMQTLFSEAELVLKQMVDGDTRARISKDFAGDFAGIKHSTNAMTEKLQQIIQEVSEVLGKLAEGNMAARIQGNFPGDFAEIKRASNTMANDLQAVISQTSHALAQLANGEMVIQITGEFAGDFSEIKNALETTAQKLAEATTQNKIQTWLKTGQSQLGEQMSGEKHIIQLAEDIINFLVPYLNAQIGAFYLLKQQDESDHLKMIASHAYVWRKNARYEFDVGEGIVGQAALERKTFVITQAPEEYIPIQSGLGGAAPRTILVAPFLYDKVLKGVIEIASFNTFSEKQLEFLNQVLPTIAIAINTAESRTKMQELLEQTQAQAEELQTQQAELQQTNEELQNQTEELQTQAEELQSQQEELRQSNEALEERSKALERQQAAITQKNAELEKTKAAIQAKAKELELASKYKSEFLANMSHELRTPLNSMLILAQLLTDNKEGNLTSMQVEYAYTIYTSGADLLTLINDILDLSKVEAGKIELNPEEVTLENLTRSLEQKYRPIAKNKNLEFIIQLADDLPSKLYTDEQRLKQVITNLLSNAFKFTSEGCVTLEIKRPLGNIDLSRSGINPAKTLAISVIDSGVGIPKDKQKIIFEAFQQADGTTSRRYGGTGLGLSISRQLIRLLGGEIQLQSEEDKGSTFTLYLPEKFVASKPLEDDGKFSIEADAQILPRKPVKLSRENSHQSDAGSQNVPEDDRESLQPGDTSLLIIEDDRNFSNILMGLAKERIFKCLLAEDGRKGLQLAETYKPSAIILDIGLPQVDGWTVMESLKENPETRHIPVHFVSGSDYSKDARQMGAIGYCLKPVSMAELGEAFKNIESFISKTVKNLLVAIDNPQHQEAILELLKAGDIPSTVATTRSEAWQQLQSNRFDCMVLDVSLEQDSGIQLLEQFYQEPNLSQLPVIIYADRELTEQEEPILKKCARNLTVKAVHSPERVLDEVTLFLHQIESQLPQEQQQILRQVRDKEAILAGKKVLLVDDDMRNIFALGAALEEKGMEVVIANNGKEGLNLLEQNPDTAVILMDIMMPKMDGYEAMQKIRALPQFRKLPIIALTAKAMKGDKAKCIEAGANDYLAKPIDAYKLLSLLRVWLSQ